jgi:hypothetical protein
MVLNLAVLSLNKLHSEGVYRRDMESTLVPIDVRLKIIALGLR